MPSQNKDLFYSFSFNFEFCWICGIKDGYMQRTRFRHFDVSVVEPA